MANDTSIKGGASKSSVSQHQNAGDAPLFLFTLHYLCIITVFFFLKVPSTGILDQPRHGGGTAKARGVKANRKSASKRSAGHDMELTGMTTMLRTPTSQVTAINPLLVLLAGLLLFKNYFP
jgi:hypothetical protein